MKRKRAILENRTSRVNRYRRAATFSSSSSLILVFTLLLSTFDNVFGVEFNPDVLEIEARIGPRLRSLAVPKLGRPGQRVQGRQAGCQYDNKSYGDGEEWDYYTSDKSQSPYYGFKLKCNNGNVDVLGCYENELFAATDGQEPSGVYDGYSFVCEATGFKYEPVADPCQGHTLGEVFDQGFYRYQCTENGLVVIACLDLDGNPKEPGDVYDVIEAYRMQCFDTDDGLVVEAIACIDEDKNLIKIGETVQSGWYKRTCQEKRDETGLQTAIALNLTACCELTTDHCIGVNTEEPSVLFPDLTFKCIQTDEEFTYRYEGENGEEVTIAPGFFSTTPDGTTQPATTPLPTVVTTPVATTTPPAATTPGSITTPPLPEITTPEAATTPAPVVTTPVPVTPVTVTVTITATQQPATVAPTTSECCVIETNATTTTPVPDQPATVYVTVTAPMATTPVQPVTVTVTRTNMPATRTTARPDNGVDPVTAISNKPPNVVVTVTRTITNMPQSITPTPTPIGGIRPFTSVVLTCPEGYILRDDTCYLVSEPSKAVTAEEAEENCLKDGGLLLVINNQEEWEFVQRKLEEIRAQFPGQAYDGFWIGLRYNQNAEQWQWIREGGWQQIPWMLKGGRARQANAVCGEVWYSGTQWGIGQDSCNHKQWYICERRPDDGRQRPTTTTPRPWDGGNIGDGDQGECEEGWVQYKDKCYLLSKPTSRLNRENAEKNCLNYDSYLVVIDNFDEYDFVEAEATRRAVGSPDQGFDGYWIGLTKDQTSGQWQWIREGGLPQRLIPWLPVDIRRLRRQRQRQGFTGNTECGEIRNNLRDWGIDKDDCGHQQGWICEKGVAPRQATTDCRVFKYRCPTTSQCLDTGRGYQCVCDLGYQGDGYTCVDIDECATGANTCDNRYGYCVNKEGTYECYCRMGYKKDLSTGKCTEYGTCIAYGDPHYKTFDGTALHYQGTCRNLLLKASDPNMPSTVSGAGGRRRNKRQTSDTFRVESTAEFRNTTDEMSWVRDVYFIMKDTEIGLMKGGVVLINGARVNLPFTWKADGANAVIRRSARGSILLSSELGLDLIYDGESKAEMQILSRFRRQTTGMCGNYDGNKVNDMVRPDGSRAANLDEMGNSWVIQERVGLMNDDGPPRGRSATRVRSPFSPDQSVPFPNQRRRGKRHIVSTAGSSLAACMADPLTTSTNQCMPGNARYQDAQKFCLPLTRASGIFSDCYRTLGMDPETFFRSCAIDVCANGPQVACIEFTGVADLCTDRGVRVPGWRGQLGCVGKQCDANMEWKDCGTNCPETCASKAGEKQKACIERCVEGCFCKQGFVLSGDKCVRPAECGCTVNGVYLQIGEYYFQNECRELCRCVTGANGGATSECGRQECDRNAQCQRLNAVEQCVCRRGYAGNGITCSDSDECSTNRNMCDVGRGEVCVNAAGGYRCECQPGYAKQGGAQICSDVNECTLLENPCGDPMAVCTNLDGSYDCRCPAGHRQQILQGKKGKKPNSDSDSSPIGIGSRNRSIAAARRRRLRTNNYRRSRNLAFWKRRHAQQRANNDQRKSFGRSAARSNKGWIGLNTRRKGRLRVKRQSLTTDQYRQLQKWNIKCQDIDECTMKQHQCDASTSNCVNTIGSYVCRCKQGYGVHNGVCRKTDICTPGVRGGCHTLAECARVLGQARCICNPGYEGNGLDTCVDVNECDRGQRCSGEARCVNTIGSFRCDCPPGFRSKDQYSCEDIDECAENACGPDVACQNTHGSYKCTCQAGFQSVGGRCRDMDECALGRHQCDRANADCINTVGSYSCQCRSGYRGNGIRCERVNGCGDDPGCKDSRGVCGPDADCFIEPGDRVKCVCKPGYTGDGYTCTDFNECVSGRNPCGPGSQCQNTPGSYSCSCSNGLTSNGPSGQQCDDVDECASANNPCDVNAVCTNAYGTYQCTCRPGFTGDGTPNNCKDIDECGLGQSGLGGVCGEGSTCINTLGSYICECGPGYTPSPNTGSCVDVNECADFNSNQCSPSATCMNTQGSYTCACNSGYNGNGQVCQRSDPCSSMRAQCDRNAYCQSVVGKGPVCRCKDGFSGDGYSCRDIDECMEEGMSEMCGPGSVCRNTVGSFSCVCGPGFVQRGEIGCEDVDECKTVCLGRNQVCMNTHGSYVCACRQGYEGPNCEDVDECGQACRGQGSRCSPDGSQNNPLCPRDSRCVNLPGSYACTKGARTNPGQQRMSTDECQFAVPNCRRMHMKCVGSPARFQCMCDEGYQMIIVEGSGFCADVDECRMGTARCAPNAKCMNSIGSYFCSCLPGYTGNGKQCQPDKACTYAKGVANNVPRSSRRRVDRSRNRNRSRSRNSSGSKGKRRLNQFRRGARAKNRGRRRQRGGASKKNNDKDDKDSPCHPNAVCTDPTGIYRCTCKPGFRGDGIRSCRDVNECESGRYPCGANAQCRNTRGSFKCSCAPGYSGDPIKGCRGANDEKVGQQVSEEDGRSASCDERKCRSNQRCVVRDRVAVCACQPGYRTEGMYRCVDIDECAERTFKCSKPKSNCLNTPGSYRCVCPNGYKDIGKSCVDIDECEVVDCGRNGACRNSPGSYTCTCQKGYAANKFNPRICEDIDECTNGLAGCGVEGKCTNSPGSYSCTCPGGYSWSNGRCRDVDECKSVNYPCGINADCINYPGSYRCQCPKGYQGNANVECVSGNECMNVGCDPNANCVDQRGTFACICKEGFQGNGYQCNDIDECRRMGRNACGGQRCYNTVGSYRCECPKGFRSVENPFNRKMDCKDINECEEQPLAQLCPSTSDNRICQNTPGSYRCVCTAGFTMDSRGNCIDMDECSLGLASCLVKAKCENTRGSYKCRCRKGYVGDGKFCTDVDECRTSRNVCPEDALCLNRDGSFTCKCRNGMVWDPKLNICKGNGLDQQGGGGGAGGLSSAGGGGGLFGGGGGRCDRGMRFRPGIGCEDIDECRLGVNACPMEALCQNTIGSYKCQCLGGYKEQSGVCRDVDECRTSKNLCHAQATCRNLIGSFICKCNKCWIGDGFTCKPDPCCKCDRQATCVRGVCRCKSGYIGDGTLCRKACVNNRCDINAECYSDPNSDTGYSCKCKAGYDGDGYQCISQEPEYCIKQGIDCANGTCISGAAGTDDYTCVCPDGYQFRQGVCRDYDECSRGERRCGNRGKCLNTVGSYRCRCPNGWAFDEKKLDCYRRNKTLRQRSAKRPLKTLRPPSPSASGRKADLKAEDQSKLPLRSIAFFKQGKIKKRVGRSVPFDEGDDNSMIMMSCKLGGKQGCRRLHALCRNSPDPPGFRCSCKRGYSANADGVCFARRDRQFLNHQQQAKREGGKAGGSRCPRGFKYIPHLRRCVDIDECRLNMCPLHMNCTNLEGAFACDCAKGYTINSLAAGRLCKGGCDDLNECLTAVKCGENEYCHNTEGGYHCDCASGYTRDDHDQPCVPIKDSDECSSICGSHGRCVRSNFTGELRCQCDPGFAVKRGSADAPHGVAILINECVVEESCGHKCSENAACIETQGVYSCACLPGFVGDGMKCFEDKCLSQPDVCGPTSSCMIHKDTGELSCACYPGYHGRNCTDINECLSVRYGDGRKEEGAEENDACGPNLMCHNLPGSYSCLCPSGYEGAPATECKDVDECTHSTLNECAAGSECVNTPGSYHCYCPNGFTGDGKKCSSLDGCHGNEQCAENAYCQFDGPKTEEIVGHQDMGQCHCLPGFNSPNPAKTACEDIDECDNGSFECGHSKVCVNTPGGFYCKCPNGFRHVGSDCEDIDECGTHLNTCEETKPNSICYNTEGSFECWCKPGYKQTEGTCVDVDECYVSDPCDVHAECTNLDGGYRCECRAGFIGNGLQCRDIDECAESGVECGGEGKCVNTIGSFVCTCDSAGYELSDEKCVDIDECKTDGDGSRNKCDLKSTQCVNTQGSYKCECKEGYEGDGNICAPIDPCASVKCGPGAMCLRSNQQCVCLPGFEGKNPKKGCSKVDFCAEGSHNCSSNGYCLRRAQGFSCHCNDGFRGDGHECTDIDECAEQFPCDDERSRCVNTPGGFTCTCLDGFTVSEDAVACDDIDECLDGSENTGCQPPGRCLNTPGSYSCICPNGIESEICDIPGGLISCAENPTVCSSSDNNEECKLDGGFCDCKPGYERTEQGWCEDIDECETEENCARDAFCTNIPGSYRCTCLDGFDGDGYRCVDIDECGNGDQISNSKAGNDENRNNNKNDVCDPEAICTNLPGSFSCACPPHMEGDGFRCALPDQLIVNVKKLFARSSRSNPKDKDQHAAAEPTTSCTSLHGCGENAYCYSPSKDNAAGSSSIGKSLVAPPYCRCKPGYRGDPQFHCTDIDECTEEENGGRIHTCAHHAECVNTPGSFKCHCHSGLAGDPHTECYDIDECNAGSRDVCPPFSHCSNTFGSYWCQCLPGFRKDGLNKCVDINECDEGKQWCHPLANCLNALGSYSCSCRHGYHGDGKTYCTKADECSGCGRHSLCRFHLNGTHECLCKPGFKNNGGTCVDIDECLSDQHECGDESAAVCHNTLGSYSCVCRPGYNRLSPGDPCSDVDECTVQDSCPWGALCQNTIGSYECSCQRGLRMVSATVASNVADDIDNPDFLEELRICEDIDECEEDPTLCSPHKCVNSVSSFMCVCNSGFRYSHEFNQCVDINECLEEGDERLCGRAGRCHNGFGTYNCSCKSGFRLNADSGRCEDLNECATADPCSGGATCVNTFGSFRCLCPAGFLQHGIDCTDLDECNEPTGSSHRALCSSNAHCYNLVGSYKCHCKAGFAGDGFNCTDIDECAGQKEDDELCGEMAKCVNLDGSYHCECSQGHRHVPPNTCQDIDECVDWNGCQSIRGSECQNTLGSFVCVCPEGFLLNEEENACVDRDECAENSNLCDDEEEQCTNVPGSYVCRCPSGFTKKGHKCVDVDECKFDPCPEGTDCQNDPPGSYSCNCQHGYRRVKHGCTRVCYDGFCREGKRCVVGDDNQPKCICDLSSQIGGVHNGQVCTKRRESFDSYYQMVLDGCRREITHQLDYYGPCQDTCFGVLCDDDMGRECRISSETHFPTCT